MSPASYRVPLRELDASDVAKLSQKYRLLCAESDQLLKEIRQFPARIETLLGELRMVHQQAERIFAQAKRFVRGLPGKKRCTKKGSVSAERRAEISARMKAYWAQKRPE
jgi:hypothetical protein